MNQPRLKILPDNTQYVFSKVGDRTFKITKELDKVLIEKSNEYNKAIKLGKGKLPKEWIYGLWANVYSASGYDYYLDPINLKIYDSKFKKWRAECIRKVSSYLLP